MLGIYKQNPENNFKYLLSATQCNKLWHKLTINMRKGITNIEELIFFEHLHNTRYMQLADNAFLVSTELQPTVLAPPTYPRGVMIEVLIP